MKINIDKFSDLLTEKIRANVESLQDFKGELPQPSGIYHLYTFVEDPNRSKITSTLYSCKWTHEDIYEHVMVHRSPSKELFAVNTSNIDESDNDFYITLERRSDTLFDCIVKEKFDMSKKNGIKRVYENGSKVLFDQMSHREFYSWMLKILQCSSENLLETLKRKASCSMPQAFDDLFDENKNLKEEYKGRDSYELIVLTTEVKDLRRLVLYDLIEYSWPFHEITRGWTKEYKFQLDVSSAVKDENENDVRIKNLVKDRLISSLTDACPVKINFDNFSESYPIENIAETIALRLKRDIYDQNISKDKVEEEMIYEVLDYFLGEQYIYRSGNENMKIFVSSNPVDSAKDEYLIKCRISLEVYGTTYVVRDETGRCTLDQMIDYLMYDEDRDNEEMRMRYREEIFSQFDETDYFYKSIDFKVKLDVSDLFK